MNIADLSSRVGTLLLLMAVLAALEAWLPFRARAAAGGRDIAPNLVLMALFFVLNIALTARCSEPRRGWSSSAPG